MIESFRAALKLPDLRNRLLFVFAMLGIFSMGTWIPVPGVNHKAMQDALRGNDLLGLIDIFSGGALQRFSIFAMGIMPYISASIMFQLLAFAIPHIKELQKEGEYGRQKIARWTRYLTVGLTLVQGFIVVKGFAAMGALPAVTQAPSFIARNWETLRIVLALSAGTCFLMWLGELITEKGIGNGISFIIFAGIVTRLPQDIMQTLSQLRDGTVGPLSVILLFSAFLISIIAIVWVTQGERRIPVRYADRVVGRRVIRGGRQFLPLRVAQAGVIPIIFAVSIVLFPAQIANYANQIWGPGHKLDMPYPIPDIPIGYWMVTIREVLMPGNHWLGATIYGLAVLLFTYFYTAVIFDPRDLADNLRKHGGQIQGFSPGLPTAQFINKVLSRITLAGGAFLALIALAAWYVPVWTGVNTFQLIGGTSLLIVVGVALETMQQLEQQLRLRQYGNLI